MVIHEVCCCCCDRTIEKFGFLNDIYELDRVIVIYLVNCYDLCVNLFDVDHLI